jgi:hypothetical protein
MNLHVTIGFLTGNQARIPTWADRFFLGSFAVFPSRANSYPAIGRPANFCP